MPPKHTLSPQAIAEARKSYDEGAATLGSIATQLGLSLSAFRELRQQEDWPARPARRSRAITAAKQEQTVDPSASESDDEMDVSVNTRQMAQRLETTVRKQLQNVESRLRKDGADAAERNARTLASLVKSLVELRRLDDQGKGEKDRMNPVPDGGINEQPPRDLEELRQELAAHLEGMQPDREFRSGDTKI